jgi:hypothetical protein
MKKSESYWRILNGKGVHGNGLIESSWGSSFGRKFK